MEDERRGEERRGEERRGKGREGKGMVREFVLCARKNIEKSAPMDSYHTYWHLGRSR